MEEIKKNNKLNYIDENLCFLSVLPPLRAHMLHTSDKNYEN